MNIIDKYIILSVKTSTYYLDKKCIFSYIKKSKAIILL